MDSGIFVGQDFIPFENGGVLARYGKRELIKIPISNVKFQYKDNDYFKNWNIKHALYFNAEPLKNFSITDLKIRIMDRLGIRFDPRIHIRSLVKKDDTYSFTFGGGERHVLLLFNHQEFSQVDSLGRWYDIFKCINSNILKTRRDYRRERSRSPPRSYRRERSRSPPRRDYRRERSRSPPRVTKREEVLDHKIKAEIESDIMKKIMVERYRAEAEDRIRKEMFFSTQYPYPPPSKPSFFDGHYPH